jgi:hypothetical protein
MRRVASTMVKLLDSTRWICNRRFMRCRLLNRSFLGGLWGVRTKQCRLPCCEHYLF